jgi:hypothetical protein
MDLLHENIFDCFCIVSSDSDFTKLAQRIREKGGNVIGLGEKKSVKAFVNACNEFIYLNDDLIDADNNETSDKEEISAEDILGILMNKALDNLSNQDGWVEMVKIVPYIKQIKPDFDISDYQINGKPIKRLRNYFENKSEYELDKENTIVRKKL